MKGFSVKDQCGAENKKFSPQSRLENEFICKAFGAKTIPNSLKIYWVYRLFRRNGEHLRRA
jgi:hypothetical protein